MPPVLKRYRRGAFVEVKQYDYHTLEFDMTRFACSQECAKTLKALWEYEEH